VEQSLSMRTCGTCGNETYEAALTCHSCKTQSDMCMITGYPIPVGERTVLKVIHPACMSMLQAGKVYRE
jgi:intraflagellar transport protein 172